MCTELGRGGFAIAAGNGQDYWPRKSQLLRAILIVRGCLVVLLQGPVKLIQLAGHGKALLLGGLQKGRDGLGTIGDR